MSSTQGVRVDAPMKDRYDEVLTDEALDFLAGLHRAFDARRRELLALRGQRYAELAGGGSLDFLPETKDVREDDSWLVAPHAPGLVDRRAEITGPTDREDDDQRAQLRGQGVAGRPRGRQHPAVGEHGRGPAQPARRDRARASTSPHPRARPMRWPTRWRPSSYARGAGT